MEDENLDDFTFTKFDDKHAIKYIINTGHAGLNIALGLVLVSIYPVQND